jgi:hypothetical protein
LGTDDRKYKNIIIDNDRKMTVNYQADDSIQAVECMSFAKNGGVHNDLVHLDLKKIGSVVKREYIL